MMDYYAEESIGLMMLSRFGTIPERDRRTDTHTDTQTDRQNSYITVSVFLLAELSSPTAANHTHIHCTYMYTLFILCHNTTTSNGFPLVMCHYNLRNFPSF